MFTSELVVKEVDERSWELVEALDYQGKTESFSVPIGTHTDFASVPRPMRWLIPRAGRYTKAVVLHDWLVSEKVIDRFEADGILRRSMRELGVPPLRRWVIWAAVRLNSFRKVPDSHVLHLIAALVLVLGIAPFAIAGIVVMIPALVVLACVELVVWFVIPAARKGLSFDWGRVWWS